jgi:hypothetical protein
MDSYTVLDVPTDQTIQVEPRWIHLNIPGGLIRIAGLLPSTTKNRSENTKKLRDLLFNKRVAVTKQLYVTGNRLIARVSYNGKDVTEYFPERRIPEIENSRWHQPSDEGLFSRVLGGIPTRWANPLLGAPDDRSPYFDNFLSPVKFWERDYDRHCRIASALHSDTYCNQEELDRWFNRFLRGPRPEGPVLLEGNVGMGKSWFIRNKLIGLDRSKYHPIIIDLRTEMRGSSLGESLEIELDSFLENHLTDIEWMYPMARSIYGKNFNPDDPAQISQMQAAAMKMSIGEKNSRRLRYYAQHGAPEMIIAFDNIDHFTVEEQDVVVDACRRIYGSGAGVRAIFAVRPTTMMLKDRHGVFFGDGLKPYH